MTNSKWISGTSLAIRTAENIFTVAMLRAENDDEVEKLRVRFEELISRILAGEK